MLGNEVVDVMMRKKTRFSDKWGWKEGAVEAVSTGDGSRGGDGKQLELGELLSMANRRDGSKL